MSDLTPRKRKLCHRIRRKESALLRKKYRSRKLKDLCHVDSDPLKQEISNSLNAEAVTLLAAIIRNSRHKPRGRRWNFEDKTLALSLLKRSPILFFRCCSLLHQDEPCNPSSILFILGQTSIPMCWIHFTAFCRICLRKIGTVVSCSMKCRSERKSGLIRNLTALMDLRILEVGEGRAKLQIMVCIASGSSQWLTSWVVEVLRLRCLCSSWMRFLVHVRIWDCMLLLLSVTWVPTMSRPWNCWVQP